MVGRRGSVEANRVLNRRPVWGRPAHDLTKGRFIASDLLVELELPIVLRS